MKKLRALSSRSGLLGLAAIALSTLAACASMEPDECLTANWFDVGLRDGFAGRPLSQLDAHTRACARAGVQVPAAPYLKGRDQGLMDYCQLSKALALGLEGKHYEGVCPADSEFRRRYQAGREVYLAREALAGQERRRLELERKLRNASNDDDRHRARDDLSDLDHDMRRTRNRVRDAESAVDRLR